MSQTDYDEMISWSIDRTPDNNIINTLIATEETYIDISYSNRENINYQENFITNSRHITSFNYNNDFIPFNNNKIHFVSNKFQISQDDLSCCICIEDKSVNQLCKLNCQHLFCIECINRHLETKNVCPLCRQSITQCVTYDS